MKRTMFLAGLCAAALATHPAAAQAPAEMSLTRLDCGTGNSVAVNERFSDTYAFGDLKVNFTYSCYLIKHGEQYLLWDTGHALNAPGGVAPKVSVVDQLAKLNVKPEQINFVGISHFHGDHLGQAASFPKATLLIGKGDWDVISSANPPSNVNPKFLEPWIKDGAKAEPVPTDKDVFGDGKVIMLNTPGHTPGHHSLMVKLAQTGTVLLTGDLAHFHENYDSNGVPWFNFDRAQTLASLDRFKKIAAGTKAKVIIQHDARDIDKLPAFPEAAK